MNVVVSRWIELSISGHQGMCFIWYCLLTGDSLYCNSSYKCLYRSGHLLGMRPTNVNRNPLEIHLKSFEIVRGHIYPSINFKDKKSSSRYNNRQQWTIASTQQRFPDLTRPENTHLLKIIIDIIHILSFILSIYFHH